jgi:hypothetical protein
MSRSVTSTLRATLAACVLFLVAALASTASASSYYLTDLGRFETAQVVLFRDQGIQTTDQVLEATLTPLSRKALASKVNLSEGDLLELARDCELMQLTGIGPKVAKMLRAAGVVSVEDLGQRDPNDLMGRMRTVNKSFTYTATHPTLDLIQFWVQQARNAPLKVR